MNKKTYQIHDNLTSNLHFLEAFYLCAKTYFFIKLVAKNVMFRIYLAEICANFLSIWKKVIEGLLQTT